MTKLEELKSERATIKDALPVANADEKEIFEEALKEIDRQIAELEEPAKTKIYRTPKAKKKVVKAKKEKEPEKEAGKTEVFTNAFGTKYWAEKYEDAWILYYQTKSMKEAKEASNKPVATKAEAIEMMKEWAKEDVGATEKEKAAVKKAEPEAKDDLTECKKILEAANYDVKEKSVKGKDGKKRKIKTREQRQDRTIIKDRTESVFTTMTKSYNSDKEKEDNKELLEVVETVKVMFVKIMTSLDKLVANKSVDEIKKIKTLLNKLVDMEGETPKKPEPEKKEPEKRKTSKFDQCINFGYLSQVGISGDDAAKIAEMFADANESVGDKGSCVLGNGIKINGKIAIRSYWQGSIAIETAEPKIIKFLKENYPKLSVYYEAGNMD